MNRSALLALTAAGLMFGVTVPLSKVALGVARSRVARRRALRASPRRCWRLVGAPRAARGDHAARRRLGRRRGYGAMVVLQNLGVERTSVTHAALIFGAVPVFVAAGSALAGRAVAGPGRVGRASAVALGGVALVAGSGGDASLVGRRAVLASARARRGADRGPGRAAARAATRSP